MDYTYILKCKDGTYYTGWTNNIMKRVDDHNTGKGAKYTKGRGPLTLVYLELFDSKNEALKKEAAIKKLSRLKKQELIYSCSLKKVLAKNKIDIPYI